MVKLSLTVVEQNINNTQYCMLAIRTTEEEQTLMQYLLSLTRTLWKYLWAEVSKYQLFSFGEADFMANR